MFHYFSASLPNFKQAPSSIFLLKIYKKIAFNCYFGITYREILMGHKSNLKVVQDNALKLMAKFNQNIKTVKNFKCFVF